MKQHTGIERNKTPHTHTKKFLSRIHVCLHMFNVQPYAIQNLKALFILVPIPETFLIPSGYYSRAASFQLNKLPQFDGSGCVESTSKAFHFTQCQILQGKKVKKNNRFLMIHRVNTQNFYLFFFQVSVFCLLLLQAISK